MDNEELIWAADDVEKGKDFSVDSVERAVTVVRELPEEVVKEYVVAGETEMMVIEVPFADLIPEEEVLAFDPTVEMGLRFFAAGRSMREAAKIAGTKPKKIRALLATAYGRQLMAQIRSELDEEFKALYAQSIEVLRDGLASSDWKQRKESADAVLRYLKELHVSVVLSAEDLVQAIRKAKSDEEERELER